MTRNLSLESQELNKIWDYGNHRAREVLEHVTQELEEFGYNSEERYMYWRGFEEGIKL